MTWNSIVWSTHHSLILWACNDQERRELQKKLCSGLSISTETHLLQEEAARKGFSHQGISNVQASYPSQSPFPLKYIGNVIEGPKHSEEVIKMTKTHWRCYWAKYTKDNIYFRLKGTKLSLHIFLKEIKHRTLLKQKTLEDPLVRADRQIHSLSVASPTTATASSWTTLTVSPDCSTNDNQFTTKRNSKRKTPSAKFTKGQAEKRKAFKHSVGHLKLSFFF